jgi:hypothetical protein
LEDFELVFYKNQEKEKEKEKYYIEKIKKNECLKSNKKAKEKEIENTFHSDNKIGNKASIIHHKSKSNSIKIK